ncbi:hypothetical protein D8674_013749 [Pyrus ussuriensis x Pyrus communis]|uniref:Uncharacterized protein n=1 Tax=Pyrus ussuriensis x Pyrus communis TaxID=2448454 RepID=A0A5N5GXM8_9ROSA|nr:hypothetical protein D8674_013749 [Pyrus ussuriensis x Pyrus communis]
MVDSGARSSKRVKGEGSGKEKKKKRATPGVRYTFGGSRYRITCEELKGFGE